MGGPSCGPDRKAQALTWRQTRARGPGRKSEVAKARIDPALADRIDRACLHLGEPPAEFTRRALVMRLEAVEAANGPHNAPPGGAR